MINKKSLLFIVGLYISTQLIYSQNQIKRDPDSRKDYVNVFYKPQYTLFDLWSDEPIFPDNNGIYHIYYATNEDKTPKELNGKANQLMSYSVYKFKNYSNCKNWCDGVEYKNTTSIYSFSSNSTNQTKNSEITKETEDPNSYAISMVAQANSSKSIQKSPENSYSNNIVNEQQKGCISGNCIDGYGIYNFNNGDYYKGDYVNGYRTGKGYYIWSNGNQYEGDFLYNTQNGKGIFVWNNGDVYGGDFVNNALQGFGIYLFKNGDKYEGEWVSGVKQGQGKYTYASGIIKEGKWSNNIFISSNTNNYKVAQVNNSYSSSESTNVNNSQSTTSIMGDIQNEFEKLTNNPLFKNYSSTLSNSGKNINGERCKKCKLVLKTPNNRACYVCNRSFSGWGFRKDYYGISSEHQESLSPCYPYIGHHNYKDWTIYKNACCSRQCAMKL